MIERENKKRLSRLNEWVSCEQDIKYLLWVVSNLMMLSATRTKLFCQGNSIFISRSLRISTHSRVCTWWWWLLLYAYVWKTRNWAALLFCVGQNSLIYQIRGAQHYEIRNDLYIFISQDTGWYIEAIFSRKVLWTCQNKLSYQSGRFSRLIAHYYIACYFVRTPRCIRHNDIRGIHWALNRQ